MFASCESRSSGSQRSTSIASDAPEIRAWTTSVLAVLPAGSVARVDVEVAVPARYRITIEWPVAGLGMQRLVLPVTT